MPYKIGKHESCPTSKPHAVLNAETGRLMGCHDTLDSAKSQLAALYIHVPDASKGWEGSLERAPGDMITKAVRIEDVSKKDGTFKIVASDETKDRYGDIIRLAGWELDAYRENPVGLWSHDSKAPPIGRVEDIEVRNNRLEALWRFVPEGIYEWADKIRKMYNAGFIKAASVGFWPTKKPNILRDPKTDKATGFEFIGQQLLELSLVPVGANPNALAVARSFNFGNKSIERLFTEPVATDFLLEQRRKLDLVRIRT